MDDQIQKTETDTYGIFQLYFYKKLIVPSFESSIKTTKKLTQSTVRKLLNEIFKLDCNANDGKVVTFMRENDIKFG